MNSRLSVSHLVAPAEVGGLESVVSALAAGLAGRGHRVRILSLLEPAARYNPFGTAVSAGALVQEIRLPPRSYRMEVQRLSEELRRDPGVIAHSHGYHADLVGARAARRAGRPIVSTAHGFVGGGVKNRLYEWLDVRALRRFDGVVAVSRPLQERLSRAGVGGDRLHLIANAYSRRQPAASRSEARRALDIPDQALVAGWIGRLSHEKGPDLFLEALALAPEWMGSVIGGGPLLPDLTARAAVLGLGPRIRWEGVIPDAGRLLAAFDVLVLSSRTEGTPMVLLEGMSAGVPLVVTRVGGIPDVVTPREALLVPPENPEGLAQALRLIRSNPGATQDRIASARHRLQHAYAMEPWIDRYEAVYRGLAGNS